jgi:outer membrane receptor protein involved in Fe transport
MAPDHAWAIINLDGVRVGGSAQTTAALGADVKLDKHLSIGADWNFMGRNYSYYSFSGSNLSIGKELTIAEPWRVPAACTVDLNGRYKFKIGNLDATFSGNINNLLNYQYILKAWNPSSLTTAADENNIYCFFNTGRTYTLRLKVAF